MIMQNAVGQALSALDSRLNKINFGRAKAVFPKSGAGCNICVPYLGEGEPNRDELLLNIKEALGDDAVKSLEIKEKSALITLSATKLGELLRLAAQYCAPDETEPDGDTEAGFTRLKLRTLAKKGDMGITDTPGVTRAAWLLLGAAAYPENPARTAARLHEACLAVKNMFSDIPTRERESVRRQNGLVGIAGERIVGNMANAGE